jgi:polysaccharide chain length determinant protein (PEP-CTERM system associated)
MINSKKTYTIDEYIEILYRRMWYIIIPFIIIIIAGGAYTVVAPRQYKATTTILVSPQRVPEAFIPTTVTSQIEERLQSIAQEVMSRTRLEQIISELRLYEKEQKNKSKEEIVELMRSDIKITLPTKKDEKGYFSITYVGLDPSTVTTVANRLASLFIEENLKIREQQAVGTTEFLESELTMAKAKLDEMETAVTKYKRRFMGELPEQRDTNLKILEQLQGQSQKVGESLRAAQDRKLYIQKQLSDMEMSISSTGREGYAKDSRLLYSEKSQYPGRSGAALEPDPLKMLERQKESLTAQFEELKARYTANHPDVIVTKKRLADLETKIKDTEKTMKAGSATQKDGGGDDKQNLYDYRKDPRYNELKNQLAMTDIEIKRLEDEEKYLSRQIGAYRARIEQIPSREQDMSALMREYASTKMTYENLLKKSQSAQQSENLEKRQKGEQFRVIDPARKPEKPFSPNVPKSLLITLFAAFGAGFGLAFFREQMDRSFHDAGDIEIALGLRVLATIPKIEEKAT